jgi:hypothetical protein
MEHPPLAGRPEREENLAVMEFAREPAELSAWEDDLREEDDMSALQNAYLGRLRRLLRLRTDHHEDLNEQGLWLLDRSIFTTYRDCVELGVGFVAQGVLRRLSVEGEPPARPPMGDFGDRARRRER